MVTELRMVNFVSLLAISSFIPIGMTQNSTLNTQNTQTTCAWNAARNVVVHRILTESIFLLSLRKAKPRTMNGYTTHVTCIVLKARHFGNLYRIWKPVAYCLHNNKLVFHCWPSYGPFSGEYLEMSVLFFIVNQSEVITNYYFSNVIQCPLPEHNIVFHSQKYLH